MVGKGWEMGGGRDGNKMERKTGEEMRGKRKGSGEEMVENGGKRDVLVGKW